MSELLENFVILFRELILAENNDESMKKMINRNRVGNNCVYLGGRGKHITAKNFKVFISKSATHGLSLSALCESLNCGVWFYDGSMTDLIGFASFRPVPA